MLWEEEMHLNASVPKAGKLCMLASSVQCILNLESFCYTGSFLTTPIKVTNEKKKPIMSVL